MTPPKNKKTHTEDDERSMSDEGVGNLFSGGGAASGALAGWATPPSPAPAPAAPVAPRPVAVVPQPAREIVADEPAPAVGDADTAKPVGFYVSTNVANRFRKLRKQSDLTHTQIVFLAVEAAVEKGLAQVVEEARRAPKFQSKLFAVAPDNTDLRGLGPVQLQYKPTRAQRQVIDGLVSEAGLPDHTKFLAVVLDQYLPGRRDA
ncbi:hypothetical protein OKJ48_10580 [Streptomyces kunmingensis]|uniref:Uncharacterized protein n=1 Tax=Streptomyces kunmingensis TaxID=68225 RepID=A0ABU6C7K7_9ACTN|nr:hypothetical protein [Streptomyces kunmingensis]MEB3960684.1 hypothetical protein [Streptomyces kunmingensis]